MGEAFTASLARAAAAARAGRTGEAMAIMGAAFGFARPPTPPGAPAGVPTGEARRRRPLGEVLDALAKIRALTESARVPTPPPLPDPGTFLARRHAGDAGERAYRLYLPADGAVGGLVVMLHGCKQSAEDFAAGTRMNAVGEANGLAVAYPAQSRRANPLACWNWFDPQHQEAGAGEPAILAGIIDEIAAEFALPPGRIYVAGLSAGGAMAAVLGAIYPDRIGAIGIHSGIAYGAARDAVSAYAAMRGEGMAEALKPGHPRLIVFQGTADRTVAASNAAAILAAAAATDPAARRTVEQRAGPRPTTIERVERGGQVRAELWLVEGLAHAWSGGSSAGSYADPDGPDASREMVRFFLSA